MELVRPAELFDMGLVFVNDSIIKLLFRVFLADAADNLKQFY